MFTKDEDRLLPNQYFLLTNENFPISFSKSPYIPNVNITSIRQDKITNPTVTYQKMFILIWNHCVAWRIFNTCFKTWHVRVKVLIAGGHSSILTGNYVFTNLNNSVSSKPHLIHKPNTVILPPSPTTWILYG